MNNMPRGHFAGHLFLDNGPSPMTNIVPCGEGGFQRDMMWGLEYLTDPERSVAIAFLVLRIM